MHTGVPPEESFTRNKINLSQVLIKTGVRFYWSENMF